MSDQSPLRFNLIVDPAIDSVLHAKLVERLKTTPERARARVVRNLIEIGLNYERQRPLLDSSMSATGNEAGPDDAKPTSIVATVLPNTSASTPDNHDQLSMADKLKQLDGIEIDF